MSLTSSAKRCQECGVVVGFARDAMTGRWLCLEVRPWSGTIDKLPHFWVDFYGKAHRVAWPDLPPAERTVHVLHTARPDHGKFRRADAKESKTQAVRRLWEESSPTVGEATGPEGTVDVRDVPADPPDQMKLDL